MLSRTISSQLVHRPLVDLTDHITRDSENPVAGGAFSDVYQCVYRDASGSSSLVAVKALRFCVSHGLAEVQRLNISNALRRELGLLRRLRHPNIVPLLGVARGFGPMHAAVLPWMPNGSLHRFLRTKGLTLTVEERLSLLLGIASGVEYLHSNCVLHGDLHSGNVLVDEECNARISDFGLSSTIGELRPGLSYLQRFSNTPGAIKFAAPEQLLGAKLQSAGDIYSLGCIIFEVLSGEVPWKGESDVRVILLKVMEHTLPSRPIGMVVEETHWQLMHVKHEQGAG